MIGKIIIHLNAKKHIKIVVNILKKKNVLMHLKLKEENVIIYPQNVYGFIQMEIAF